MDNHQGKKIGFTCAYTPLPLLHAAGYVPFRVLPMGDVPDRAGQLLHDNLCPHVKRVLDRAMDEDLPTLHGMVFMNSCDTMRRLADAWQSVRTGDRVILLDLPSTVDKNAVRFFAGELERLAGTLADWSGHQVDEDPIRSAVDLYNDLAGLLDALSDRMRAGKLSGGSVRMQQLFNMAATHPVADTLARLKEILSEPAPVEPDLSHVPVHLFGNVLPNPEVFSLLESCGARVVDDDFCTGSRQFSILDIGEKGQIFTFLSESILKRPPCARTFSPEHPGKIADDILHRAESCGAKGVIGHTMKFCDPYLARLPIIRETLRKAALPLLLLEGDCTLRSMEQQRTRIEAFVEMLK